MLFYLNPLLFQTRCYKNHWLNSSHLYQGFLTLTFQPEQPFIWVVLFFDLKKCRFYIFKTPRPFWIIPLKPFWASYITPIHLHLCLRWRPSWSWFMFETVGWHMEMLLHELQHLQWLWSITVEWNLKAVACYLFNLADPGCFSFLYVQCAENTVFAEVWYSCLHESFMFTFQWLI